MNRSSIGFVVEARIENLRFEAEILGYGFFTVTAAKERRRFGFAISIADSTV